MNWKVDNEFCSIKNSYFYTTYPKFFKLDIAEIFIGTFKNHFIHEV